MVVLAVLAGIGHVKAHDEYSEWKMPGGGGASCCNERVEHGDGHVTGDCRPVRATQDDDGTWTAWVDGLPVRVPADKVLPFKAKDGRSHWCGVGAATYCFTAGDVRS